MAMNPSSDMARSRRKRQGNNPVGKRFPHSLAMPNQLWLLRLLPP
jgi:hypothetical protein